MSPKDTLSPIEKDLYKKYEDEAEGRFDDYVESFRKILVIGEKSKELSISIIQFSLSFKEYYNKVKDPAMLDIIQELDRLIETSDLYAKFITRYVSEYDTNAKKAKSHIFSIRDEIAKAE